MWDLLEIKNMVVGEQPYKSRDMVGSDSGLGHLHRLWAFACKYNVNLLLNKLNNILT